MPQYVCQLAVKLYADGEDRLAPDRVIRAFHTWIQESSLPELLIDVTDYSHVPGGPGVLLIAYGAQVGVDRSDGRLGLVYRTQRDEPGPPEDKLRVVLHRALTAASVAQRTPALRGQLTLSTRELRIRLHDRLLAPNTAATFEALSVPFASVLESLYGAPVELSYEGEGMELLAVRARAAAAPSVDELLARLDAAP